MSFVIEPEVKEIAHAQYIDDDLTSYFLESSQF